jgi:hypothetical protein
MVCTVRIDPKLITLKLTLHRCFFLFVSSGVWLRGKKCSIVYSVSFFFLSLSLSLPKKLGYGDTIRPIGGHKSIILDQNAEKKTDTQVV